MKALHKISAVAICLVAGFLGGCATPVYDQGQSMTSQGENNMVRYGMPLALGAGGFAGGEELFHSTAAGVGGAALGVGLGAGIDALTDSHNQSIYAAGLTDGAGEARNELVQDKWTREVLYGLPADGTNNYGVSKTIRDVHVPAQDINGIDYPAHTETTDVYH